MTTDDAHWGLPDPVRDAEFYADVPVKRLVAWVIDTLITGVLTVLIVPFTAFTAIFFLPALFFLVNLAYRIVTVANRSATPGMRLVAIEFRTHRGERFDLAHASLHTLGFLFSMSMVLPQAVSIVLMLTGPRAQGLTDLVLGTAAVNRAARS